MKMINIVRKIDMTTVTATELSSLLFRLSLLGIVSGVFELGTHFETSVNMVMKLMEARRPFGVVASFEI
jgi:ethanolamine utilization protein EutP (predicted NTPase)